MLSAKSREKTYIFKIETGKTAKNLNRFFDIFEKINFITKDIFPKNSYDIINKVYDNGNTYVHARKSSNTPKDDAIYRASLKTAFYKSTS